MVEFEKHFIGISSRLAGGLNFLRILSDLNADLEFLVSTCGPRVLIWSRNESQPVSFFGISALVLGVNLKHAKI